VLKNHPAATVQQRSRRKKKQRDEGKILCVGLTHSIYENILQ
jgi:hypothetical protein